MIRLFLMGISVLLALGARAQDSEVVNRVMAVVGGTKVITLYDVQQAEDRMRNRLQAFDPNAVVSQNAVLTEMINEALLVQEIYSRKNFVLPAGIGEDLVKRHIGGRADKSRSNLIRELQREGRTLQRLEQELIDDAFLRIARQDIEDSIQISPQAVKDYFEATKTEIGAGPFAKYLAFELAANEFTEQQVMDLAGVVDSEEAFRKLAETQTRPLANDGQTARVYFDEKFKVTWYLGDGDLTPKLSELENGQAGFEKVGDTYHMLFVIEQNEDSAPSLTNPRVRDQIRYRLMDVEYAKRLQRKVERLKQTISVVRPSLK